MGCGGSWAAVTDGDDGKGGGDVGGVLKASIISAFLINKNFCPA